MNPNLSEFNNAVSMLDADPEFARQGRDCFGGVTNREVVENALSFARAKAEHILAKNIAIRAKVKSANAQLQILKHRNAAKLTQAKASSSSTPPSPAGIGGTKSNSIPSRVSVPGQNHISTRNNPSEPIMTKSESTTNGPARKLITADEFTLQAPSMTRQEFAKLSPQEKGRFLKSGGTIA